jgi:hypothetical protein
LAGRPQILKPNPSRTQDQNLKGFDPILIAKTAPFTPKQTFQNPIVQNLQAKEVILIADPGPRMLFAVV